MKDNDADNNAIANFHNILEPLQHKSLSSIDVDSNEQALLLAKAPALSTEEYTAIQQYLNSTGRPHSSYKEVPHPEFALVLPPAAERLREFVLGGRTYSRNSSHDGNSAIQFYEPST